jgi:putative nucleotidyltransferase with HDIG domain
MAIAIVNIGVVTLFTLLANRDFTGLAELVGAGVAAAVGGAIAALGSFVVVGSLFGITTSFQLLELANPTQKLLRRLMLEANGTYNHSLLVGNLAERAAEAIGADPLLARVASYYHDVGKLDNPLAYIENQAGGENVHDELTPEESVALVKAHVAKGIDLAYQYKLPKPIIAFIPQHHGTALISYFHARAKAGAKAGAEPVDDARFRHSGPKPQSKEAAILMLADGVEASVRSLSDHDEPAIRAMVDRIIRERLEDGQFDECDLTLRDVERIREAFVAQLLGMYHRRVEYPQNKIVEIESRRAAGNSA